MSASPMAASPLPWSRALTAHLVLRLALLWAVFACAVLLVDYVGPSGPTFCGAAAGCAAVRRSSFSHVGNAPLPALGLVAQLSVLVVVVVTRDKAGALVGAIASGVGAVAAAALIAIQAFVVGAFCKWCMFVDVATILAAVAAFAVYRGATRAGGEPAVHSFGRRSIAALWVVGALALCALPFVWADMPVVPPLPAQIAARAVPGKLTIVTFTDFECPFCRRLSPAFHEIVNGTNGKVALVRVMAPLAAHPGALPAAYGYLCAPNDKREAMATLLYGAPTDELTPEGVKAFALGLHIDEAAYDACIGSAMTVQRLEADRAVFTDLGIEGLPYTYVGDRTVLGFNPPALFSMVDQGLGSPRPQLPIWAMLALAAGLGAALAALTARVVGRDPAVSEVVPAARGDGV